MTFPSFLPEDWHEAYGWIPGWARDELKAQPPEVQVVFALWCELKPEFVRDLIAVREVERAPTPIVAPGV